MSASKAGGGMAADGGHPCGKALNSVWNRPWRSAWIVTLLRAASLPPRNAETPTSAPGKKPAPVTATTSSQAPDVGVIEMLGPWACAEADPAVSATAATNAAGMASALD